MVQMRCESPLLEGTLPFSDGEHMLGGGCQGRVQRGNSKQWWGFTLARIAAS